MTSLNLASDRDLEQFIQTMGKLDNEALEKMLAHLSIVLARRKAAGLPGKEADLLAKINQGAPDHLQQRHTALTAKLQANRLTDEEHHELIDLIDQLEQANAERVQALVELSNLRGISVGTLMQQLGIQPPQP